jgi:hypothetical protein
MLVGLRLIPKDIKCACMGTNAQSCLPIEDIRQAANKGLAFTARAYGN